MLGIFQIVFAFSLLILCGCASPALQVERFAADAGFSQMVVDGGGFNHLVYFNQKAAQDGTVHVYLEGDGRPWINNIRPSTDPTPRNPLMLRLMGMDMNAAVYLGRPCYCGFQTDRCNSWYWTFGRYSKQVIDSMAFALEKILLDFSDKELVFTGHSGGAALAVLLAERFETKAVITISGLLDTERWVKFHEFTPLIGSENPATKAQLAPKVIQLHYAGAEDKNIPPNLNDRYQARYPQAEYLVFPGVNHVSWEGKWPEILENLHQELSASTILNSTL